MSALAPYLGYIASLLLIIALLVSNDLKFRWFNTGGNIFFIGYAIILGTIPVLITNCILLCINAVYLVRVYRHQENFDIIEFSGEENMIGKFIRFYEKDIHAFFPGFEQGQLKGGLNFVVLRDMVIANIFSAEVSPGGDAEVIINYTLKKYRDYKVGRFIFDKEKSFLISKGVKRIVYREVPNNSHLRFLKVMGFLKDTVSGNKVWVKSLISVDVKGATR